MKKWVREWLKSMPLETRIRLSYAVLLLPFAAFMLFCLANLWRMNMRYDELLLTVLKWHPEAESTRNGIRLYYSQMLSFVVAGFAILTVATIVVSYLLSRSITKPIGRLSRAAERVARGELSVRVNVDSGGEVETLARSMNTMIVRTNRLVKQVTREQTRLRKAELELLQSQINPHFLYNTLDTIIWLAEAGDQPSVVSMVGSLADFFRVSLSQGRDIVTVREELKHVYSYLQIQQVRYQDILEYSINVPEELFEQSIPKITLQPLVENALYHGIKNKRGMGRITLWGERQGGVFRLYVSDNGIGMKKDRLKQVSDTINNPSASDDEIFGLNNVNERIRMKFGGRYGIHVDSSYLVGTLVTVLLPYKTEHGEELG